MMLPWRRTYKRIVACFAAAVVSSTFTYTVGGEEVEAEFANMECQRLIRCNAVPVCPTGTGECDYCNHPSAEHEICVDDPGEVCEWAYPNGIDEGGCGVKIEGTCDDNDVCQPQVTLAPCHRMDCIYVGP